jgi:hypothetical protein
MASPNQLLPARADVALIEVTDHVRVDLAAEPEGGGALAGQFPSHGVVRHRPGAAAAVLTAGEVSDIMARVQRHSAGHDL